MSSETKPYNELAIKAWTILSVVVTALLTGMYVFGTQLLHVGQWVWDLIRYLASPII